MTKSKFLQKLFFLLLMGSSLNFVCACGGDNEEPSSPPNIAVTGMVGAYGGTYADISGYANLNQLTLNSANIELGIEIRNINSEQEYSERKTANSLIENVFIVAFDNLSPSTEYEYRSFVEYNGLIYYGEYHTFTTKRAYNITSTGEVFDVTDKSAAIILHVQVDSLDSRENYQIGVAYSTIRTALHKDSIFDTKTCYMKNGDECVVVLSDLSDNTVYYYASFTLMGEEYVFSDVKSFTTNHLQCIDLGLSVKWAAYNVGASSPEEYGGYYAWGEIDEKKDYSWSSYKWCDGSFNSITKYCTNSIYGIVDNQSLLELSDDVAHVKWGGNWRMPTLEEMKELVNKCSWQWTTYNGVNGQLITGPNGNSIFLPAAGDFRNTEINLCGLYGYYWSASLNEPYSYDACRIGFNSSRSSYDYGRCIGCPVRPVTE